MRSPIKTIKHDSSSFSSKSSESRSRSASSTNNLDLRQLKSNETDENPMPTKLKRRKAEVTQHFKIPESPSVRLAKLRISVRPSPEKDNSTSHFVLSDEDKGSEQKHNLRSPLKKRNTTMPITLSALRTPRRSCKDDALSKILVCFDKMSTSPCASPKLSKSIARRNTDKGKPKPLKLKPELDCDFDDEDGDNYSSASSSESSSGVSSSEDSSASDDSDDWLQCAKSRSRRPSEFKKHHPSQAVPSDMVFVPQRTADSVVNSETLNLKLHASRVPECLPCREAEFDAVFEFLIEGLQSRTGGCMYISGVPGTGKTATVTAVLGSMATCVDKKGNSVIPPFTFISINGMQVSEPRQSYVQIYEALSGVKVSAQRAMSLLEAEFCAPARLKGGRKFQRKDDQQLPAVVLLIDELDLLCSKRQDVLYSLFDWPCREAGRRPLLVLAIANTMDLPERLLHHRVASRLGLNRLPFAPYSHEQLALIVRSHLNAELADSFAPKAIELATRKVAAVSGDARRALDICRRAAELAQLEYLLKKMPKGTMTTTMTHINLALNEMFASVKLSALRALSVYEKLFLRAIVSEASARGLEEVRLDRCMEHLYALCTLEGFPRPTNTEIFEMSASLGAYKLILVEPSRRDTNMLIHLNCSQSDVLFVLKSSD